MSDGISMDQLKNLISGNEVYCDYGCLEEEVPSLIDISKAMFPDKPYRVVRQWSWIDIDVNEQEAELFRERGLQPAYILAWEIIEDETKKFAKGSGVRTTVLVAFHKNCLFVTRNTAYILVGQGRRLTMPPAAFSCIVF